MSDEALRALVSRNPGQATLEEYRLVDAAVRSRAPCNLLVFGVGRDTGHWVEVNPGGRTVFLEEDRTWADRARRATPEITVYKVTYRTRHFLWPLLRRAAGTLLLRDLPREVTDTAWDVVFIDGPRGTRWYRPGRVQSIYTAARLDATANADIFVHDCNRTVERESSDRFIGRERLIEQVGSMRHYRRG